MSTAPSRIHRSFRRAANALAFVALAAAARAQSFNVDVGATAGTDPGNAYGAAAAQPGFWNWFEVSAAHINGLQGLSPLAGGAPVAAVRFTTGAGGNYTFNSALAGDEEALMDDCHDIDPGDPATYEFVGLAAGGYWIYTYAWAPDNAAFRTRVEVPGSDDPAQDIGGVWPGAHRYQITYSKHFRALPAGAVLTVIATQQVGFGSVNGFQLVYGGAFGCDGEIDTYCTAKVNSAGCTPAIHHFAGPPSAGACACPFNITATGVLSNVSGLLFYSRAGPVATPFFGGTLCAAPPLKRTALQNSGGAGACGGVFGIDFNAVISADGTFVPGESVWAQWYYRDTGFAAPNNIGLSDALHFTVCF
jgi:hypothetical protein